MPMAIPVAITGLGAMTPAGAGTGEFWRALFDGSDLFSGIELFDVSAIACRRAGVCAVSPAKTEPRALRLAEAAVREALADASAPAEGTALIAASNFFSYAENPDAPRVCDAGTLAERLGLTGVRFALSLSCASGASAAAMAATLISNGRAKRVVVAGYDALAPFSWCGLCSLRTMSSLRPRPFSAERDGTVFSEGAIAVVFEAQDVAKARGVRIRAMLSGWATGNNAYHLTAPPPRAAGSMQTMSDALACSGFGAGQVDAVIAHATGTSANDVTESEALVDVFGSEIGRIPVTGIKGAVGHMMGASGLAELSAAVKTIEEGCLPPCAGSLPHDERCVPNVVSDSGGLKGPYVTVLCNSAGFGGCNASTVVRSAEAPVRMFDVPRRKVYVAGVGAVCAAGFGIEEIEAALAEGVFWDEGIPDYEATEFGVTPKTYVDDVSKHALCACAMALGNLGSAGRLGLFFGTENGCVETSSRFWADYLAKGARFVRPFLFPHTYDNAPASLAAMEFGARGAHLNFSGTSSGAVALLSGYDAVAGGLVGRALVCGCDKNGAAALLLCSEPGASGCELVSCGFGIDEDEACRQAGFGCGSQAGKIVPDDDRLPQLLGAARLPLRLGLALRSGASGVMIDGGAGCKTAFALRPVQMELG